MNLRKIKSEDLIFTNEIEDDRTNTYLKLYDYDWMDYNLSTRFKTKEHGVLDVTFSYFGMTTSRMDVVQNKDGIEEKVSYSYSTELFKKHITIFLEKHLAAWDSKYAFNGEEEVIKFFNDVIKNGKIAVDEI